MQAILWATLIAGTLDITVTTALRVVLNGVAVKRVPQSVASGVLGPQAFAGGWRTAVLGLLLHFMIMAVIAALFYIGTRFVPLVSSQWQWTGFAYGIAVYLVMSFVVVPLSAFPTKLVPSRAALFEGVLVHIVCVGLPIAFVTCRWFASG
jgi:hypothetical protein